MGLLIKKLHAVSEKNRNKASKKKRNHNTYLKSSPWMEVVMLQPVYHPVRSASQIHNDLMLLFDLFFQLRQNLTSLTKYFHYNFSFTINNVLQHASVTHTHTHNKKLSPMHSANT